MLCLISKCNRKKSVMHTGHELGMMVGKVLLQQPTQQACRVDTGSWKGSMLRIAKCAGLYVHVQLSYCTVGADQQYFTIVVRGQL